MVAAAWWEGGAAAWWEGGAAAWWEGVPAECGIVLLREAFTYEAGGGYGAAGVDAIGGELRAGIWVDVDFQMMSLNSLLKNTINK